MSEAEATTVPANRPRARWRAAVGPVIVFGLSCLVFAASARVVVAPPAWRTFEFCQYAEIGRNLARDGAYETRVIEPMALAYVDRAQVGPTRPGAWPVVNRYPLPCVVIAALFRLCGVTDLAAAWSNGLAIGLLAATLYAAARAWFGGGWAALAAALWLLNPSCYGEFILLGTPDVWFAALFLLHLLLWSRLDPIGDEPGSRRARWGWVLGAGALGGLAYLARFNASVFLAVEVLILLGRRRWREALVMGGAVLAVAAPSLWDTWRHFGRPTASIYSAWNLLDKVGAYRVEPWLYYQVPDVGRTLLGHWHGVVAKLTANLATVAGPLGVWRLWRLEVLIPLALCGAWLGGPRGGRFRRLAGLALGLFGLQLVLFSGLRLEVGDPGNSHNGRYFFWFAPVAVLLGVATLRRLGRRRWGRPLVAGAVGAQVALFGMGWQGMVRAHWGKEVNIGQDPVREMLAELVRPGEVIASNQPHVTAWFCGLRSISLPADPDELDRLNRESPTKADYLFVDLNFNTIDLDPRWRQLVAADRTDPSGWGRRILAGYRYVIPLRLTRGVDYAILRRANVPPGAVERRHASPLP